jgi:hypothetical protein
VYYLENTRRPSRSCSVRRRRPRTSKSATTTKYAFRHSLQPSSFPLPDPLSRIRAYLKQLFALFQSLSVQQRLFKSLKLWSFYVDLEESIGTVETTKAVYDRILELRIANAQVRSPSLPFSSLPSHLASPAETLLCLPLSSRSFADHRQLRCFP